MARIRRTMFWLVPTCRKGFAQRSLAERFAKQSVMAPQALFPIFPDIAMKEKGQLDEALACYASGSGTLTSKGRTQMVRLKLDPNRSRSVESIIPFPSLSKAVRNAGLLDSSPKVVPNSPRSPLSTVPFPM